MPALRWLRLVAVVAMLLLAVWFGLKEGFDGFRGAATTMQRVATVTQMLYGASALASLVALFRRQKWLKWALIDMTTMATITGFLAPIAWGGTGVKEGLLAAASVLVVGGLVTWGALAAQSSVGGRESTES